MKNNILIAVIILTGLAVYFAIPAKIEYVLVSNTPSTTDKAIQECQECLVPQTIVKEVPVIKEVIREVVKEVPKEVIKEVPVERIIYQNSDLDCRIEMASVKKSKEEMFNLYAETIQSLNSYKATTTEMLSAYGDLYNHYESLLTLTKGLNTQYLFSYPLTEQLVPYYDFLTATSTWKFVK